MLRHNSAKFCSRGTAACRTIVHVNCHSAVVNQCSDCLNLSYWRAGTNLIRHIVPIVCGSSEIHRYRAILRIVFWNVSMTSCSLQRMVPIFHELCCGSSHTTGIDMSARTVGIGRTAIVIRVILIPCSRNQIGSLSSSKTWHYMAIFTQRLPVSYNFIVSIDRATLHTVLIDSIQILFQSWSHVVRLKSMFFRITDNRAIAVVSRKNHKAVFSNVKDIKRWH